MTYSRLKKIPSFSNPPEEKKSNSNDKAILTTALIFNTLHFMLLASYVDENALGLKAILLIYFTCILMGYIQNIKLLNHQPLLASEELTNTRKTIDMINSVEKRNVLNATLDKIDLKPLVNNKLLFSIGTLNKKEVEFEMNSLIVLEQAKRLKNIWHELEKILSSHEKYLVPLVPKIMENYWKYLPHLTHKFDMPSKNRLLNFNIGSSVLAGQFIWEFFNTHLSTMPVNSWVVRLFYCSCLISVTLAESYVLNVRKMELNLKGFMHVYRPYNQWPPTCIGQQFTKKLVLYPHNPNFLKAIEYIFEASNNLEKVLQHPRLSRTISPAIRAEIDIFHALVTKSSHEGKECLSFKSVK